MDEELELSSCFEFYQNFIEIEFKENRFWQVSTTNKHVS